MPIHIPSDRYHASIRKKRHVPSFSRFDPRKELALIIRRLTPDPGDPSRYRMTDKVKIANLCRPAGYTRHGLMHTFDSGDPEEWEDTWSAETLPGAEISLTFLRRSSPGC